MNKVISAFPGTGKSHLTSSYGGKGVVLDSDSSSYSWLGEGADRIRNPDFPSNYMRHITGQLGTASLILVSTHEDVRNALVGHGIRFSLAYPERGLKDEYLERFERRGSPEGFITLMDNNWDTFIGQLEGQQHADHVVLQQGQYLGDIVDLSSVSK